MAIFATSRHAPDHLAAAFRDAEAENVALKLKEYYAALRVPRTDDKKRLIVTSPLKRAVVTAEVYARVLDAEVIADAAFDDNKESTNREQMVAGVKILGEHLLNSEFVFLVTHMPIVVPLFVRTVMHQQRGNNQVSVPNYSYGVYAVDLPKYDFFSFGKLGLL